MCSVAGGRELRCSKRACTLARLMTFSAFEKRSASLMVVVYIFVELVIVRPAVSGAWCIKHIMANRIDDNDRVILVLTAKDI